MAGTDLHFEGREQGRDVRRANIEAAKAVSDSVRTSLGPKGMDKMITSASGDVIITNDGATILKKMNLLHPASRMLVELSNSQDVECGDGTTTVVVLCGALLGAAEELMTKGIHPSAISDAWLLASKKSVEILRSIAHPIELKDKKQLIQSAVTSLNSKVVGGNSGILAPLAVEAVLRVVNEKVEAKVDLKDIRIAKKVGGTVEDTRLVDGIVFEQGAVHTAGGPSTMKNCKIGLIQFCLSAPKTDMENSVVVSDYTQMDRILKEERQYIRGLIKKIVKSGCNVLLIQKSILRDAVNELSLHYLAKKKIMVITQIERSDIEFICKSTGCIPIAHIDNFTPDMLGEAESCVEKNAGGSRMVEVTGVKNQGRAVSILLRASNRLMLDEAERSLHDALCVVRCLVKEKFLIAGGSAPECSVSYQLGKFARTLNSQKGYCIKAFAEALEVIPYTLAENAGLSPVKITSALRKLHASGQHHMGINIKKGAVTDMWEERVIQPLLVTMSAIKLAAETCVMLMKIDDIVSVR